ncbi:MAG: hypothetical protein ACE5KE_15215 [Methanosarcinales archaeon]
MDANIYLFRSAPIKKIVRESESREFEEMKSLIDMAAKSAIEKKKKVIARTRS